MNKEEYKNLNYWKQNATEDYMQVPISVLRYISELEQEVDKRRKSEGRNDLPEFLYEDDEGIKIGFHGDSLVTEEWNKWKG
jgi:hypothetical protein